MVASGGGRVAAGTDRLGLQLDGDVLNAFSDEPDFLTDLRRAALALYNNAELPTTRLEEWRYTDPSKLKWDKVAIGGTSTVSLQLPAELAERGVIVMDLARAATELGERVAAHLGVAAPATTDKFVAMNATLWSSGLFVYVPRGVVIDEPIRIVRTIHEGGYADFFRTLIIAEDNSQIGVVEEMTSGDLGQPAFSCGVAEIFARNSARVQYVALQQYGANVYHLGYQRTVAQRDSKLDTLVVNLGGSVARVDLAASLKGPGARSDMLGLYFAQGDQHFDHATRQNHEVPHATSDLLYKGALDGKGRSVFRGLIKVYPKAQRTDAYQTNRNLILSRTAEATSLPNLEIEADDVRCSHAATVGQLDEEELFYIMSRGIARRDAERLVVFGFFGDVLGRLPMPGVVAELKTAIAKKIAG